MNIQELWNNSGGTIVVMVLLGLFIVYAIGPWAWRFIDNRWVGVIKQFGDILPEPRGQGPQHIWKFVQRMRPYPLFPIQRNINLPSLPTAGPNSQPVRVKIIAFTKFVDAVKSAMAVLDRDPLEEFDRFVAAAVMRVVQSRIIEAWMVAGGAKQLAEEVLHELRQNEILQRWGMDIDKIEVVDFNPSKIYQSAIDQVVAAEGRSRAAKAEALGVTEAAKTMGGMADYLHLRGIEAAQAMARRGAFKTFVLANGKMTDLFQGL